MGASLPPGVTRPQFALFRQNTQGAVLASNRCDAGQPTLASGGSTQYSFRIPYTALAGFANPVLVFSGTQMTSSGEVIPVDSVEVKAVWETAAGDLIPVYSLGSRTPTLTPGADLASDPIPVKVAAGDTFYLRTRPKVDTLGKKWLTGGASLKGTVSGGGGQAGDVIDSATAVSFNGALVPFQPSAILAQQTGTLKPTALLHGSSSVYGSVDTSLDNGDYGYAGRMCTLAGIPHVRAAVSGYTLSGMLGTTSFDTMAATIYLRRLIARTKPTFVFAQMSPNDVTGGASLATVQARLTRYWDFWAGLGLPIVEATWHPKTTSSDGWTTLPGQTTDASDAIRQQVNAWKLTLPHSALIGVIDEAEIVQAPSDASKYRVDIGTTSADGTHINAFMHEYVAAAKFGQLAGYVAAVARSLAA